MCRYQSVLQMRRAMQEFARVARGYSRRSAAAIKVQVSNCKIEGSGLQSRGSAGQHSVQVALRLPARQLCSSRAWSPGYPPHQSVSQKLCLAVKWG